MKKCPNTVSGNHFFEGGYWFWRPSIFSSLRGADGEDILFKRVFPRECTKCKIWDDTYKLVHKKSLDWKGNKS